MAESSCPYHAEAQQESISQLNSMPHPSQLPAKDQATLLSTERESSSIPMGGRYEGQVWIYPSEQASMFFNAMKRKNWNPNEKDMEVVVPIHNAVNEQAWKEILQWESLHESFAFFFQCKPKLLKFQGKPKELSLKARWKHWILGFTLPFDRHDWIIDRCGHPVRYIIDFYSGSSQDLNGKAIGFYLDARPAPSFSAIKDYWLMFRKTYLS